MKNKCLICDSLNINNIMFKTNKSVSSDNRIINFSLSHSYCVKCGYIFINFEDRVDYELFYSEEYKFLLDGDVEPTLNNGKYSEILVEFYSEFIEDKKENTFFDIGGGKGNFVQAIYDKFENLEIYALEPSKSYTQLKEKLFLKESYNDFFTSSNFYKTFDYLSVIGVLEHVPNPKQFLLDIKKIMTIKSFLLIEVPNFKNNKSDLLTIDHLSKFTEESITNIFNICGLHILKKQVLNNVPMQFIVQVGNYEEILSEVKIMKVINDAVNYLENSITDAKLLKNKKIAIYGQGIILDYLIGTNILNIKNICCIIDDNPLYQTKKYNNKINIFNFKDFKLNYFDIDDIFLAMNDCYHNKVENKLNGLKVYGAKK